MNKLVIIILLFLPSLVFSQTSDSNLIITKESSSLSVNPSFSEATFSSPSSIPVVEVASGIYSREVQLSLLILLFGLIVLIIEYFVATKTKMNSNDIVNFMSTTLLIIASLYLISAGWSSEQIAPAIGLLGTIAGYLLGRSNSTVSSPTKSNENS